MKFIISTLNKFRCKLIDQFGFHYFCEILFVFYCSKGISREKAGKGERWGGVKNEAETS